MNIEEQQYLNLLKNILTKGNSHDDRTGTGTYRLWGEVLKFNLNNNNLPLLTTKKMTARLIIEELLWFLQGCTDVKKLQDKNVKIWNGNGSKEECEKFNRSEGDLGPIYGHQWRNFNASLRSNPLDENFYSEENQRWVNKAYNDDGYDQIKYVIETILNNPNSRRIIFSGWHASEAHIVNPPPCHTFYQFQVDNGKLNSSLTQRSGDVFLGVGFNIASLAIMTHLFATVCNLEAGSMVHIINDAHIYKDHVEQSKIQMNREPYPFPTITINSRLKNTGFKGLMSATIEDFTINDYQSHKSIKAKMSV